MGWISKYSKTLILYVAVTSAKELSGNRMGEGRRLAMGSEGGLGDE